MWNNSQENTTWVSRTDGQPVCIDCIFYNEITRNCSIRKNESTTLHPASCNFYKSEMSGE